MRLAIRKVRLRESEGQPGLKKPGLLLLTTHQTFSSRTLLSHSGRNNFRLSYLSTVDAAGYHISEPFGNIPRLSRGTSHIRTSKPTPMKQDIPIYKVDILHLHCRELTSVPSGT